MNKIFVVEPTARIFARAQGVAARVFATGLTIVGVVSPDAPTAAIATTTAPTNVVVATAETRVFASSTPTTVVVVPGSGSGNATSLRGVNVVDVEGDDGDVLTLVDGEWRPEPATGGGGSAEIPQAVWAADVNESTGVIVAKLEIRMPNGVLVDDVVSEARILVTDGSDDYEPSSTSTITAGGVGTLVAGSGTATAVVRTVNGVVEIKVHATPTAYRYLWVMVGGNTRGLFSAKLGVHELIFT